MSQDTNESANLQNEAVAPPVTLAESTRPPSAAMEIEQRIQQEFRTGSPEQSSQPSLPISSHDQPDLYASQQVPLTQHASFTLRAQSEAEVSLEALSQLTAAAVIEWTQAVQEADQEELVVDEVTEGQERLTTGNAGFQTISLDSPPAVLPPSFNYTITANLNDMIPPAAPANNQFQAPLNQNHGLGSPFTVESADSTPIEWRSTNSGQHSMNSFLALPGNGRTGYVSRTPSSASSPNQFQAPSFTFATDPLPGDNPVPSQPSMSEVELSTATLPLLSPSHLNAPDINNTSIQDMRVPSDLSSRPAKLESPTEAAVSPSPSHNNLPEGNEEVLMEVMNRIQNLQEKLEKNRIEDQELIKVLRLEAAGVTKLQESLLKCMKENFGYINMRLDYLCKTAFPIVYAKLNDLKKKFSPSTSTTTTATENFEELYNQERAERLRLEGVVAQLTAQQIERMQKLEQME